MSRYRYYCFVCLLITACRTSSFVFLPQKSSFSSSTSLQDSRGHPIGRNNDNTINSKSHVHDQNSSNPNKITILKKGRTRRKKRWSSRRNREGDQEHGGVGNRSGSNKSRLQGGDMDTLLSSIGMFAHECSLEELTDALSRLVRMAPCSKSLHRMENDPRFVALLERITELSPKMPSSWAPFVLSSLTKLSPDSLPSDLLQALQARIDVGVAQLSPIGLCTVAFSFSRLRYVPVVIKQYVKHDITEVDEGLNKGSEGSTLEGLGGLSWWLHFVEITQNRLIEFSPWELSQLIRSLMVQAEVPKESLLTPSFLNLATKCAQRRLTSFMARDLEGLLTSLSKLDHYRPSDYTFLEQLVQVAHGKLSTFRPHTLSRFLHALSRIEAGGFQPSNDFLQRAEAVALTGAGAFDQGSIALIFQAWSWLRYQPNETTLNALLKQLESMLEDGSMSPLNMGTLIQSLGELRRCPEEPWLVLFREAALGKIEEMGGKDLNFCLKGLAKLNWFPGEELMSLLLQRMIPSLASFQGPDLQFTITALVGLHYLPPTEFIEAFKTRVLYLHSQNSIAPRDASIILWSFAALEIPGSGPFYRESMQVAAEQLKKERLTWSSSGPKALSSSERWSLMARLRQLRQVFLYAESKRLDGDHELHTLVGDLENLGLLPIIEEGLSLMGDDSMVLAKAQESSFHKEVSEVLQSMGANVKRVVDIFVLDVLLEPQGPTAEEERSLSRAEKAQSHTLLPIVLLLHGPSRFLRNKKETDDDHPILEAGTNFKERILQTQSPQRFAMVASLNVWEWAQRKSREAKIDLLKTKIGSSLLQSYLSPNMSLSSV